MTIAVPIWQGRVSPLLDTAARLLVVKCRDGREAGRREILLGPLPPEALARSVAELRVDLLLCAALSEGLYRALRRAAVRVRPHICGEVEAVLSAFCHRRLDDAEFRMPGCWGAHRHGECCQQRRAARAAKPGRRGIGARRAR